MCLHTIIIFRILASRRLCDGAGLSVCVCLVLVGSLKNSGWILMKYTRCIAVQTLGKEGTTLGSVWIISWIVEQRITVLRVAIFTLCSALLLTYCELAE